MKIVNLFTGQKRLLLENYNSYSNIQLANKKNNYNFFVFWDDALITKDEEYIIKKNLYNFKYKIISQKNFKKKYKKIFQKIKNDKKLKPNDKNQLYAWLHQYYILNEAYKFARSYLGNKSEKYAWQRIRSDSYIPSKIDIDSIIVDKNSINFPGAKFGFGLNDFHCVGNHKYFKIYASSIDLLRTLIINSIYIPPEVMISIQLTKYKAIFGIDRRLPSSLIGIKNKKIYLRSLNSREKGYQYIDFNFSKFKSNKDTLDKSESYFGSFFRRIIWLFVDLYQKIIFFFKVN